MQARKLRYISLDFDGSLFHTNYVREKMRGTDQFQALQKTNAGLIDFINQDKYSDEIVYMVGSNRQSIEVDRVNSSQPRMVDMQNNPLKNSNFGSCFEMLPKFSKAFSGKNCRYDDYLLADSYGKVLPSTNFKNAMIKNNLGDKWFFDHTKITILYAQMHKAASEN